MDRKCLDSEELNRFLTRSLSKEQQQELEFHLISCPACRQKLLNATGDSDVDIKPVPKWLEEKVARLPEDAAGRNRRLYNFSRVAVVAAAAVLMILGSRVILDRSQPPAIQPLPSTSAYWIQKYGILPAQKNPMAIRADRVFRRVVRVADRNTFAEPRLILVANEGTPYALALRDGSVVLSSSALQLCYQNAPLDQGDSRLAFVLGHELVHQKNRNFLHSAAFAAVDEQHATQGIFREKELNADAYGMIYATMAGYDPRAVLQANTSFIESWVSQVPQDLAYKNTHPDPKERAAFLREYLKEVSNDLDFFHFGVRLYQLGRYDDAIIFLQRFAEKFPAREVFNNIGLCHYQLAIQSLASCDPMLVNKAYPATMLDTQTLAGQFRSAGPTPCLGNEVFREQIQIAEQSFRKAIEMDPAYLPASVNLSSAQMVKQHYPAAMQILNEVLKVKPNDSAALNNKAVALYYSDRSGYHCANPPVLSDDFQNSFPFPL